MRIYAKIVATAYRLGAVLLIVVATLVLVADGRYLLARNLTDSLSGDWFVVDLTMRAGPYMRGSLVAFRYDGRRWGFAPNLLWAKRIVGLPGDRIDVADGAVWVAGVLAGQVDPNVMKRGALHVQNASKVPPGHVFVVGDSQMSLDSRYAQFGFVPLAQLQGLATPLG